MKLRFFLFSFLIFAPMLRAAPTLPTIPSGTFNITNYGAIGDDVTTNTTAIQNAISAASNAGGGTVEIPAGTFLSGPLTLANSINLQLDSGAILQLLPYGKYPGGTSPSDFITASSLHDLEISGSGAVDGQGSDWWNADLSTSARPVEFYFAKCNRVLVQNVTFSNSPSMHLVFKNGGGNITVQGITINTSGSSPNTDGIDLVGTNCLVQNSYISDGDDNIAFGSTSGTSSGTVVTNCTFGQGHGISIGSNTEAGVSNLTVVACSFNGTQYGIRMKSDNASSSGGAGGMAQNLLYHDITMTNISKGAIVIYSYYNEYGTPIGISPSTAASQTVASVSSSTCIWRNIVISNLTASVSGSGAAGIIWGRTELAASNILFQNVNISAPATFDIYNARLFEFFNSHITVPSGNKTFTIYNAGMTLTNDTAQSGIVTFDGVTSTNSLAIYNVSASTTATNIFGANPITVSGGALTVSNNFIAPAAEQFYFAVGTNSGAIASAGNLSVNNATIKLSGTNGVTAGTYTLFTYAGILSGSFALSGAPTNFSLDTGTTGEVNLIVSQPGNPSLAPVNVSFQTVGNQLQFSWPGDHTGWELQMETNLTGANWTVVAGSQTTNQIFLPIDSTVTNEFFRLFYSP